MTFNDFKNRFSYDPSKAGWVGIERERFLVDGSGRIVPAALQVMQSFFLDLSRRDCFGFELSACQLESRTPPVRLWELKTELQAIDRAIERVLNPLGLGELHSEVGPSDMPLDIYPDPTGRYQKLTKDMPVEVLRAACRVIGTHVHVGMRDHEEALRVYNHAIRHLRDLCEAGNGSFGERLAIYRQVAPDFDPRPYDSWRHYHATALDKGFADDPRKCWTLIRISVHGTIEFRMFGATGSLDRVVGWAERCHALCAEVMAEA
jgi:gamma-glutamyl:cysteine ligase YbdK (ATP-grasp superfamily)